MFDFSFHFRRKLWLICRLLPHKHKSPLTTTKYWIRYIQSSSEEITYQLIKQLIISSDEWIKYEDRIIVWWLFWIKYCSMRRDQKLNFAWRTYVQAAANTRNWRWAKYCQVFFGKSHGNYELVPTLFQSVCTRHTRVKEKKMCSDWGNPTLTLTLTHAHCMNTQQLEIIDCRQIHYSYQWRQEQKLQRQFLYWDVSDQLSLMVSTLQLVYQRPSDAGLRGR